MRNYRLSHLQDDDDDDVTCIQMISALVLQLVQSVAKIPPPVNTDIRQSALDGGAHEQLSAENVDENQILSSLDLTDQIQKLFLTIFLDKISGKKEEIDYRPLFENFIQGRDLWTVWSFAPPVRMRPLGHMADQLWPVDP